MSSIFVDPNELRKFANALNELAGDVRAHRNNLEKETSDIRSFWDDSKYRDFVDRQETLMLQVQIFERLCERHYERLIDKAAKADAYLGG